MQYDLIIIGSGSVGAAAGYYARRAGLNVLMTDAHQPPHQEGSHHGSSRLIRHAYGEGEKYVPLVLRAQPLWDELAEISGEAVFERTGVINLGPASSAFLANVAASARAFQLEVEELDAQAVMQRWPEIRLPDDYRAIFEPASGVLRSELAVETWIRLAREAGCAQLFNCPVSAIHHHADGITIDTLDGEYHGKKLLVSAGTWVTRLLPDLPIQPVRKVFAWYQADGRYSSKNHFPAFTGELPNGDQYYGFPAEDNELNAEIAAVQLEEFGMNVERAVDGKNAVEIFRNHPEGTFDVILMDIMMPEMNGYEAAKAIRAMNDRPDGKNIPIIAMTANSFAEDVQASLDAGMNAHLSKPIVIGEVIKTILRYVDTSTFGTRNK